MVSLPIELEREIFELAILLRPNTAATLTLVAKRVQIWVERIIYNVVALSDRRQCSLFLRTIDSRPAEFFDAHVKSLCLPYCLEAVQVSRILSVCRNVEDLGFWAPADSASLQPSSSKLPRPRRLSVSFKDLFCTSTPDFSLPFFAQITHLRVVDGWVSWTSWPEFHRIPLLTHLAIDISGAPAVQIPRIARALLHILKSCANLEVCLLYTHKYELAKTKGMLANHGVVDQRIVILAYANPQANWAACKRRNSHEWKDAEINAQHTNQTSAQT